MKKILLLCAILQNVLHYSQNTVFWKVTKPGNTHTSYLLGTYHQMGNSFVDSLKTITNALENSQTAIFENIDTGNGLADYLNLRKENFSYRKKLDKKYVQYLDSLSQKWAVPVSKLNASELLLKIQQIYFQTQCDTVKPQDTESSFDNYLIKKAKNKSIKLVGLESNSEMTSYISAQNDEGWKKQKTEIYAWLDNVKFKRSKDRHCIMAENYLKQKLNYELDLSCEKSVMISDRNEIWLPKIEENLNTGNTFIAVGYLHLTKSCGLISELRKRGFTVEPVYKLDQ